MGSQCLTSRGAGRGGTMVVKDIIDKKEKSNREDTNRVSDDESGGDTRESDHRNGIEERPSERWENVRLERLQEMIPSVAAKDNVAHLDIILEAIRYIDSLRDKLADKIERGEIVPLQVTGKRKREEE